MNRHPEYDDSFSLTNLDDELMGTSTRRVDELDYDINTSTLDRAFPDFSQIQTSEEEEPEMDELSHSDLDMSVEVGRGAANQVRDDSRSSMMSFENSVRSSSPAMRVEYPTPQKPATATRPARRAASENLRKNAQVRRATQAQKENMSPQMSQTRDQRRTFSDMHAKVRDSYEGSFLGDERPAPITTKTRSTRFGNANTSQEVADAVERASRDAYAKEVRKSTSNAGTPRKSSANAVNNTIGDTMTHQSFLLPDLPNISELVSGVYEDGTPVYSRQGKMRSTRFVSPLNDITEPHEHMPLDAVPVPEDEKALFVHLRLLQDKVAELEMFKSEAEKRMDGYRQENASLKSNKPRQSSKYDSEDNEYKKGSKRLAAENQKLEAANLALQNQLDIADRKAQVQESAIKRMNHDRESAITQLGAAYLESRELKVENEELREENAGLKGRISRLMDRRTREHDTGESEASSAVSDVDESQVYTEPSGDMSRSTKDLTSKSARSNTRTRRQDDSRAKVSTQVDKEISRLEKERADEALFSIEVSSRRASASKPSKPSASRSESKSSRKQPNTSKQRVKRVVVEDFTEPEVSQQTKASSETGDMTLLSLIDENEISRLRRTLEEERLMRKQRRSNIPKETNPTETVNSTRQSILKTPAPRKSSLRESKPEIPRPASAAGDITTASKANAEGDSSLSVPIPERSRRHSDNSLPAPTPRKKQRNVPDMTSAFILPDITLHHVDLAASDPSKLPQEAQKALDSIAQHNGPNCTVCKGHSNDGTCNHESVKVPKPVPVSERMPKPSVYNEEPTMRPSQPPAVALAIVLKGLEDELSHLKMQLATYQGAYNKLDASLGKRPRKTLQEKIDKIFKDIDMKADQIYALYDVVEGQKQDGHEMTEQEMEMTLESIGLDIGAAHADVTATTDKSSRHGQIDLDDEEDLPWEGIESTGEMTGHLSIGGR